MNNKLCTGTEERRKLPFRKHRVRQISEFWKKSDEGESFNQGHPVSSTKRVV